MAPTNRQQNRGRIPGEGVIIWWAEGLGEPANLWLEAAGYPPISPRSVVTDEILEDVIAEIRRRHPGTTDEDAAEFLEIINTAIEGKAAG